MKFTIEFFSRTHTPAIYTKSQMAGLDALDRVRNLLDLPELKAERVNSKTGATRKNPKITISEELARESGCFRDKAHQRCKVPRHYPERWLVDDVEVERDEETGEILHAKLTERLDEDALINHWREEGFPLEISDNGNDDDA